MVKTIPVKKYYPAVLLYLTIYISIAASHVFAQEQYISVRPSTEAPKVSLGGTVVPFKEVTLTAQLPGRVNFIAGIEGNRFKANSLLVSLDDSELKAKSQAAYAQWANAEYALRSAGFQFSREYYSPQSTSSMGGMGVPNLFDRVFTKPMEGFMGNRDRSAERAADFNIARIRIEQARMQMATARSEMDALAAKIRDAKSLAPFDGVIMDKFVETGDTVQPGQPLLTYANLEHLQIEIDVPLGLARGLKQDMVLQALLAPGKQPVPVRVAQIYPMADAQQHTVTIKFDLAQGDATPGMYVKVLFPNQYANSSRLPIIPVSAIRYKGGLQGVYVKSYDGELEFRLIRVGEEISPGLISILAGVKPGEQVLENPRPGTSAKWSTGKSTIRD